MNYHFFQAEVLSRRAVPAGVIAAFHLLVAYLLLTALVQAPPAPRSDTPIRVVTIKDPPTVQPPALPDLRPHDKSKRIEVPPVPPLSPADPRPNALPAEPVDGAGGGTATVVPPLPVRLVGSNVLPNTADYYPPPLIREGVQGATSLRVCVDAQGVRQGEATIEQTSGNVLLDRAALDMARHGRYARAMQGDSPVGNCYRFRITFQIPK